ncbi:unnamed protein product [Cyprideis torosa]|uniref:RING-type E3 ubiquitin transferase n=1 Tax=Cyprideis torosa TaxID=163714 RepID=A0A7R8ZTL8_9CRUS|nr:unnamed protein product [Cyprideis torosa]CAG0898276.1 unnamed protein product [Cyprideis torosa]
MLNPHVVEVLRGTQRDNDFVSDLADDVRTLLRKTFGVQIFIKWNPYIDDCARVLYYSLTTLSDVQTLGEEYGGLLLLDSRNDDRLPARKGLMWMVFLETFGSYLMLRCLKASFSCADAAEVLLRLRRLHTACFFMGSPYPTFSKRVLGIQYILVRHWIGAQPSVTTWFRLLGVFLLLRSLRPPRTRQEASPDDTSSPSPFSPCPICQGDWKSPSALPCGHVFCWSCVHKHLAESPSDGCPLCRFPAIPSRVVALVNVRNGSLQRDKKVLISNKCS